MTCETEGCGAKAIARGLCARCYRTWHRGGTPAAPHDVVPTKQVAAFIPVALADRLYRRAQRAKVSVSKAIEEGVRLWLKK